MKRIIVPEGLTEVLLHACCAPCSSAIVEWMLANGIRPTIFYFNPNIYPLEEYEIRKNESKRHAESLGLRWIDGDYDHAQWRQGVCGLEDEPERGRRCEWCFRFRLMAAAHKAKQLGLRYFTTTLASSRWKSLEQIERAGLAAQQAVPDVIFWAQNWRKGGLYERRNQLLKEYAFYNQQYCGCEFSVPSRRVNPLAESDQVSCPTDAENELCLSPAEAKRELRRQMREAKRQHAHLLQKMSEAIVDRLLRRLADAKVVMGYWPLPDEVDIRPLLDALVASGKTVVLPKVVGDELELYSYHSPEDLREGAFHILEPLGPAFTDVHLIDIALIPGMAFDAACHRLGRGRGYYDRFLSACPSLFKLGVCFPFQRVPVVPAEVHDITMDEVLS